MSELVTTQQKMNNVRGLLLRMKDQIALAAPRHLSADRVIRVAMTSIQKTPKLADCTQESLLGALLTCTQLGLEPDSAGQKAHLIPFAGKVVLVMGYRGLMELAMRSGKVASLEARVVYAKDKYKFCYGAYSVLEHQPCQDPDGGALIAAYAVAHMTAPVAPPLFEWMWKKDIDAIRARSKAGKTGPWDTDYDKMARKTVIKLLCKYLPSCPELQEALNLDTQADIGEPQQFVDVEGVVTEPAAKPKSLEDFVPGPFPGPMNDPVAETEALEQQPGAVTEQVKKLREKDAEAALDAAAP